MHLEKIQYISQTSSSSNSRELAASDLAATAENLGIRAGIGAGRAASIIVFPALTPAPELYNNITCRQERLAPEGLSIARVRFTVGATSATRSPGSERNMADPQGISSNGWMRAVNPL